LAAADRCLAVLDVGAVIGRVGLTASTLADGLAASTGPDDVAVGVAGVGAGDLGVVAATGAISLAISVAAETLTELSKAPAS